MTPGWGRRAPVTVSARTIYSCEVRDEVYLRRRPLSKIKLHDSGSPLMFSKKMGSPPGG